jgi:hypothetical protein
MRAFLFPVIKRGQSIPDLSIAPAFLDILSIARRPTTLVRPRQ